MPQLNGKKYAYTKKGKEQYKKDKKKKYTLSSAKKKLASMGRRGDTELEHVNKQEQRMLRRMGASRSTNPRTGLTENFNVIKSIQSAYDRNVKPIAKKVETEVKAQLPSGLDAQNVGDKIGGVLKGAEEHGGKFVTELVRAPVKVLYTLAGQPDPYNTSSGSGSGSGTTTMSGSGGESGFGGMKRRKKKKKPGEAEGDSQGQNTQGGKMSKRGLRTPKRTGLNIVKKNSSSTSLGM
jgi:hypothetical protein